MHLWLHTEHPEDASYPRISLSNAPSPVWSTSPQSAFSLAIRSVLIFDPGRQSSSVNGLSPLNIESTPDVSSYSASTTFTSSAAFGISF